MRYNRLTDLGLTEAQIRDNLIFTGDKVGETMKIAMPAEGREGVVRRGAARPLGRSARSRGADWLYTYLRTFYRDPKSATGWNNAVFPNVGMPHVLWELQGERKASRPSSRTTRRRSERDRRQGPRASSRAGRQVDGATLATDAGTLTQVEYDSTVADLVNFLAYMGEPARNQRSRLGIVVLLFLGVLFIFA